jgi:hypothetical protein
MHRKEELFKVIAVLLLEHAMEGGMPEAEADAMFVSLMGHLGSPESQLPMRSEKFLRQLQHVVMLAGGADDEDEWD